MNFSTQSSLAQSKLKMWLFCSMVARWTDRLCITKGQGWRIFSIRHSYLEGSLFPGAGIPAGKATSESKGQSVSQHPWLLQDTSDKYRISLWLHFLLLFLKWELGISPFSSTHLPKSVKNQFNGFSKKILNLINCHNNWTKAGRNNSVFLFCFVLCFTLLKEISGRLIS